METEIDFKDKVIVITGASAGVGRATAKAFGKQGAKVVLIARGLDGLEGARREVEEAGGQAFVIPLDVADAEKIEEAAQKIETEIGEIDVWINNAMNSVFAPVTEIKADEFKRVTEVTYLGQVYGTMAALKRMLPRDRGSIILVGSALAYRGIPLQSAYCGAKHGIQGFFDSLRCELIHDKSNVHLCMVQLPAMNTTQFGWVKSRLPNQPQPMGKIYEPEVAADAIVYAAAHNRRDLYVGMPTFDAIIGNKIAPGIFDHYLALTGYEGQQTDEPVDPDRKDNLWEPVPGDQGTYGNFGETAHKQSVSFWMSTHRALIAGSLLAGAVLTGLLVSRTNGRT